MTAVAVIFGRPTCKLVNQQLCNRGVNVTFNVSQNFGSDLNLWSCPTLNSELNLELNRISRLSEDGRKLTGSVRYERMGSLSLRRKQLYKIA